MTLEERLRRHQVTLRVGHALYAADGPAAQWLDGAVAEYNDGVRLAGLRDELNPLLLDQAKVQALAAWLACGEDDLWQRIEGQVVLLNDPQLGLHVSAPTRCVVDPATVDYKFAPSSTGLGLGVDWPIDLDRAAELAAEGRRGVLEFDAEVREREQRVAETPSEKRGEALRALALAQQKRFAAASVWRCNAAALAAADPTNTAAAAESDQARQAADRFVVAPWTGMPRPGQARPPG